MSHKRTCSDNSYYRIKKKRFMQLNEETDNSDSDSDSAVDEVVEVRNNFNNNYSQTSINDSINSSSGSFHVESIIVQSKNETLLDTVDDEQHSLNEPKNFYSKIIEWVINNIGKLPSRTITELLNILINEGYKAFPRTAHALLGFKHSIYSKSILTKNGSYGQYLYLGILNGLEKRITPEIFTESSIKILVFIDGMKIYNNSKGQLWPIVIKLHANNYLCPPFTAGLFYGEAKPTNVRDILNDFVEEVKVLTNSGVTIKGVTYSFELIALIADGQARAYLKCIKGPTAYFGCERCTIEGITEQKRRVYPEINCEKRTKRSFIDKVQIEHHQGNISSPLTKIPYFDPVNDVILDSMHLLFLGVMKSLLVKWTETGSPYRLKRKSRKTFKQLMDSITQYVPTEFQRKIFDINEASHWKATQYRFMLLYVGPIILKFVLNPDEYKHFLILHVACRILCSQELAVQYVDYADGLLKKFFQLMPSFYGEACQVMNFHNLIHVADDVRHFQIPLNNISAFWGESYIGKFKHLVQSAAKPLPQIVNRLNAIDSLDNITIKVKHVLEKYDIDENAEIIEDNGNRMITVNSLKLHDMFISCRPPNNTVQLKNNTIFMIKSILLNDSHSNDNELDDFCVKGFEASAASNIFKNPCESTDLGSVKIHEFSTNIKCFSISKIKSKCLLLQIDETKYAVSLLHSS